MNVKIIKTSVMKMQHVEILMAIILVLAMMDSWVMVSLVQVCEFIIVVKPYQFLVKCFSHLIVSMMDLWVMALFVRVS